MKDTHLNKVPLQQWISEHIPSDDMCFKESALDQMKFVRDKLGGLFFRERDGVFVIGEHHSKSIPLPVYLLEKKGIQIILRDNFFDWKMSVISEKPIQADFEGLFRTISKNGDTFYSCYFEGFPEEFVFDYYQTSDHKKWSASIGSDYLLYATIFLILKDIGDIKSF